MPRAYVYTRQGEEIYYSGHPDNYRGHVAKNCDVYDAVHLALCKEGEDYVPMRNNTGILFAKADLSDGCVQGITKTLVDPWVFRLQDGSFGLLAIQRRENEPDPDVSGCISFYRSADLVRYEDVKYLRVSEAMSGNAEIRHPRCHYDENKQCYELEWMVQGQWFCGCCRDLATIEYVQKCAGSQFTQEETHNIPQAVSGNSIEISESETAEIEGVLGRIYQTELHSPEVHFKTGEKPAFESLPKTITCLYNDGSTHQKRVQWNRSQWKQLQTETEGNYEIKGVVQESYYPWPMRMDHISDPHVCQVNGVYYLNCSGQREIIFRKSETLQGLAQAEPFTVYSIPETTPELANMWAPELHIIHVVPYLFTTVGGKEWYTVRCHILRCKGADALNLSAWEEPRLVRKMDGTELEPNGISLDMTCFCINEIYYVMWSNRRFRLRTAQSQIAEPADIYIATIDPDAPWQLTSEPVCILRPMYGWDRYETEVDEGPYLLRHGEDLFVTISGSSTGLGDLYCVGLLHSKEGSDLLTPDAWDWQPYPALNKESVSGEYGPGHNCFMKDPDTGDDLMVYHAVCHTPEGRSLGRKMGIRRVHWTAKGLPYLEMTREEDLKPECREVSLRIIISNHVKL